MRPFTRKTPETTQISVVGPYPPLKGGISQHTAQMADGLSKHGSVRRISWAAQYPQALYGRTQVDPAARATPGVELRLRWWDPVSWWRTGRLLRHDDAVVIPWVSPVHAIPYLTLMLAARPARFIMHVHNAVPHERMPFARLLLNAALRRVVGVVCHGQAIAEELRALSGSIAIAVTDHPPDLDISVTPLPEVGPIRLLFAGTIREYKGLDVLLEALALLGREDIDLTIAGEVWSEDARPDPSALKAIRGHVHCELSYVSDERLCELMQSSHALVAPYRSASQSGIVALAAAAGRPSVVTPVGALGEFVLDGVTGVVAERADDPVSLANAIVQLIENLDDLASGVRQHSPTWADYAKDLLELLARAPRVGSSWA